MYENFLELKNKIKQIKLGDYLEFGCGNGAFLAFVLENNNSASSVTAIDNKDKAVSNSRALLNNENINFVHYSSLPFPFKGDSFDTITISNAMHHIEDKKGVSDELKRVLKTDGRIIVSEMVYTDFTDAERNHYRYHSLRVYLDEIDNVYHDSAYKKSELLDFFKKENYIITDQCIIRETKDNIKIPEELKHITGFIDDLVSKIDSHELAAHMHEEISELKSDIIKYGIKRTPQLYAVLEK